MPAISGFQTLTVGTSAVQVTNGGALVSGGQYPSGIRILQSNADAGVVYIGDSSVASTYPPIPKGSIEDTEPLFVSASSLPIYLISGTAAQSVFVYPG